MTPVDCTACGDTGCTAPHDCEVCGIGAADAQCDGCERTTCSDCRWVIGVGPDVSTRCLGCEEDRDARGDYELQQWKDRGL